MKYRSFGKSRLSSRVVIKRVVERLIVGLPPARCVWFNCAYVVILYRRKGVAEGRLPWFDGSNTYVET